MIINPFKWFSWRFMERQPLITIKISQKRLLNNLHEFQKIAPNNTVAPVLKSNGYGHGLLEIANMLSDEENIPFLVVDSYFEAVALRFAGIKSSILIIGFVHPETIYRSRMRNVCFTITSLDMLRKLVTFSPERRIKLSIKIDTGMRRQGILPNEIDDVLEIVNNNPALEIEGVCSHLYEADSSGFANTESQINIWNKAVKRVKEDFPLIKYMHLNATDGHRFRYDSEANMSRLGLGLYGLTDGSFFTPSLDLKPVMEIETIITSIKTLKPGETVGYNGTFRAEKEMRIATIPFGYYEGLDRRLSNKGHVLVGFDRHPCPIIGRISMNISSIDISGIPDVSIGTPVVVISRENEDKNSIIKMAETIGTIAYEIAVHIPSHLKRLVIE